MKTVGELLRKTRLAKDLTLVEVERAIKVRVKYLEALEKDEYIKLPGSTYIQGFLKNYASFLGLDWREISAIFRRSFTPKRSLKVLPSGLTQPLSESWPKITPPRVMVFSFILALFLFFGYLFKGYFSLTRPPILTVEKPKANEVIAGSQVEILGETDKDALLMINNQPVFLDQNGRFRQVISLEPGEFNFSFVAKNRFGKTAKVDRRVIVKGP